MILKSYSEIQSDLKDSLEWASLSKGRAQKYGELLEQLTVDIEKNKSRETLLCSADLMDILEIHESWKIHETEFPGLKNKIRESLEKGPMLPEDEDIIRSDNRARNDRFVYLFAGKLLRAGIQLISIDGIPQKNKQTTSHGDIVVEYNNEKIVIECKRPQKTKTIETCAKKGRTQINQSELIGCLAIDCSKVIRPPETLYEFKKDETAQNELLDHLENNMVPKIRSHLRDIFGAFLMASVPAMKIVHESSILSLKGTPFRQYSPRTIKSLIIAQNSNEYPMHSFLRYVHDRLNTIGGNFGFLERPKNS